MKWSDQGIVLSAKKHGENSLIVVLLTENHGKHAGLVRGGTNRRVRGIYEPGNFVIANWSARLEEHLGTWVCELVTAKAGLILNKPLRLSGLSSACAVAERSLPEREPHPIFFSNFKNLVDSINLNNWTAYYVNWEINLLAELGFGLDLTSCAATGSKENLIYVSPKSGRAVSKTAGKPYHHKLLPLPLFLRPGPESKQPPMSDLVLGLELTQYFLERHIFSYATGDEPSARTRFVDRLRQLATISCIE